MVHRIHRFLDEECGAVTIDWVVLAAVAAAFGVIVATTLGSGTDAVAENIGTSLTSVQVTQLPQLGYSQ